MSDYFHGNLVSGVDLETTTISRNKKYKQVTVDKTELDSYLKEGWKIKTEFKKKVRLVKDKNFDELLEDDVWMLFKNMGFTEMNKDRNFRIRTGRRRKQIDVFAKDKNNAFVIQCTARAKEGHKDLKEEIYEMLSLSTGITNSMKMHYDQKLRCCFLLVTRNIIWSQPDIDLVEEKRGFMFFHWKEKDLDAYIDLTKQLRDSAKIQMYNILFQGKKIYEIGDIEVPAIFGGKGKYKFYSFIIQPEKLLEIAYVHRREESNPREVSGTYQRMIKKRRLDNIYTFINSGGFFSNNIVLNFSREPLFEKISTVGDIKFGILKFPQYYGSAWIIDGQHRLFGYSGTERKATDTLPVVAFVNLDKKKQGNLFVEINKEQKAVSPNLLWDLYPDIYEGVKEDKYQILGTISLIVKKLNSEPDSPLHKHIKIPSVSKESKKVTNLTLANICDGIKDNRLVNKEERLLYDSNYEFTVNFAYERLKVFFDIISKSFPEDWQKGDDGLLRTNIGIRIFLIIFRQLLRYLKYEGLEGIYRRKNLGEFRKKTKEILERILNALKMKTDAERDKIRKGSAKGLVMENAQRLLWDLKEEFNFGLELWRKGGWTPGIPKEKSNEQIKKLIDDSEIQIRLFIIKELEKIHENKWWNKGIPVGVQDYIKRVINQDISRTPWKKQELLSSSPEEKMFKTSTSHLKEIIINGNNWEQFKNAFAKDKENVSTAFKYFENIRNKFKHQREKELDEIERGLGYWNMRWIRRCIGLNNVDETRQ